MRDYYIFHGSRSSGLECWKEYCYHGQLQKEIPHSSAQNGSRGSAEKNKIFLIFSSILWHFFILYALHVIVEKWPVQKILSHWGNDLLDVYIAATKHNKKGFSRCATAFLIGSSPQNHSWIYICYEEWKWNLDRFQFEIIQKNCLGSHCEKNLNRDIFN